MLLHAEHYITPKISFSGLYACKRKKRWLILFYFPGKHHPVCGGRTNINVVSRLILTEISETNTELCNFPKLMWAIFPISETNLGKDAPKLVARMGIIASSFDRSAPCSGAAKHNFHPQIQNVRQEITAHIANLEARRRRTLETLAQRAKQSEENWPGRARP